MTVCKECGEEYTKTGGRQLYCSDCAFKRLRISARKAYTKARKERKDVALIDTLGRNIRRQVSHKTGAWKYLGDRPGSGYEIDHIIPLSNAKGCPEYMEELNHPCNLRWLTREENQARRGYRSTVSERTDLALLSALEDEIVDMWAASDYWGNTSETDVLARDLDLSGALEIKETRRGKSKLMKRMEDYRKEQKKVSRKRRSQKA